MRARIVSGMGDMVALNTGSRLDPAGTSTSAGDFCTISDPIGDVSVRGDGDDFGSGEEQASISMIENMDQS
jgi:hypothetical protein